MLIKLENDRLPVGHDLAADHIAHHESGLAKPMARPRFNFTSLNTIDLCDQLIAAPSHEARLAAMERFKASWARLPREWPTMPAFDGGPRKAQTELRPRHLHMVGEYGFRSDYDRDALGEYFLANWYRLFGPLRESKALEVPSDQIRKELMVSRLLDLIEMRAEYATERALH